MSNDPLANPPTSLPSLHILQAGAGGSTYKEQNMSNKVPGPWRITWLSEAYKTVDFLRDRPDLGEGITEKRTMTTAEVGKLVFPDPVEVPA